MIMVTFVFTVDLSVVGPVLYLNSVVITS